MVSLFRGWLNHASLEQNRILYSPLLTAYRLQGIALNEQLSFSTPPISKFRREKLILEFDDIMKSYRQHERTGDSNRSESPAEEAIRNREWNLGGGFM